LTSVNSTVTTGSSFDPYGRPQTTTITSGSQTVGQSTVTYSPNHVVSYTNQSSSVSTESDAFYDPYGRTIRSAMQSNSSPLSFYIVDTCYDSIGRVSFKSYPYTASSVSGAEVCSGAGDTYTYDALGRTKKIQHADAGATSINYAYTGSATKVTDENGVSHINQVDGLGRTSIVCEVSSNTTMPNSGSPVSCGTLIAGNGFVTSYAYLNNVTTVTQGAQTRKFTYDGLGRLISKVEGELVGTGSGAPSTVYSYSVNSNGPIVTRQTPRAGQSTPSVTTTTTYQYDVLNRLTSVTYNDGVTPTKTYTYDSAPSGSSFNTGSSLGLLTSASNSASTTLLSYDPLGRVNETSQCLAGLCGTSPTWITRNYTYDWQSNPTGESYSTPGGQVNLAYGVNLAGQLLTVTGGQDTSLSSLYSATATSMTAYGPVSASLGNGLAETLSFDALGHPAGLGLTQSNNPIYAWTATWSGSRVTASKDSVNGGSASYTYDDMNRLSVATPGSLNLNWTYDRYGNRWSQSASGSWPGTVLQPSLTFSNATNQITTSGYQYDVAGDLTQDPLHTYTYDAEGNLTAIDNGSTATYLYDALNHRVQATQNGATQDFGFNAAGRRATVWSATGSLISANYYAAGAPLAYYLAADGHAHFEHQDWVGTERFRTKYNGSLDGTFLSLPYGDGLQPTQGSDTDPSHYTGLDQDQPNLEHAAFRELSSVQGRWLRPDPYDGSYNTSDPQSLNRYAYAGNSPVSYSDQSGLLRQPACPPSVCVPVREGGGAGYTLNTNTVCFDSYSYSTEVFDNDGYDSGDIPDDGDPFSPSDGCIGGLFVWTQQQPQIGLLQTPNIGMIGPISRTACAAMMAEDRDSIAANTTMPENPIVQAFLGNSISGLYNLWNAPSVGSALKDLALGGYNPGIPTSNPISGGLVGLITSTALRGAAKALGTAKLAYDVGAFAYAYAAQCSD